MNNDHISCVSFGGFDVSLHCSNAVPVVSRKNNNMNIIVIDNCYNDYSSNISFPYASANNNFSAKITSCTTRRS